MQAHEGDGAVEQNHLDSPDTLEDSQYSIIEPSRPTSRASSTRSQLSPFQDAVPDLPVDDAAVALGDAERPASRASSLSSGITLISRPVTPVAMPGVVQARARSETGSQSGWEDLGDESSDDEGSLVSSSSGGRREYLQAAHL